MKSSSRTALGHGGERANIRTIFGVAFATTMSRWGPGRPSKYLRRYFAYLERSIDKGTQWAVFESNGDLLWANVRRTIEDFLLNE